MYITIRNLIIKGLNDPFRVSHPCKIYAGPPMYCTLKMKGRSRLRILEKKKITKRMNTNPKTEINVRLVIPIRATELTVGSLSVQVKSKLKNFSTPSSGRGSKVTIPTRLDMYSLA